MNCRSVEKWVWQEGAGNLPAAAVTHASGCPDCRALIDHIRLLDRSVGVTVVPDPGDAYWEAMRERIALRLENPTDRVIELTPRIPVWKRFVAQAWAPATAVALLAVIASQRTFMTPPIGVTSDHRGLARGVEELSAPSVGSTEKADRPVESGLASAGESNSALPVRSKSLTLSKPTAATPLPSDDPITKDELAVAPPPAAPQGATSSVTTTPEQTNEFDAVWPERQITIMGKVDSNSPSAPTYDERRLAAQDQFGAYERQKMAEVDHGLESVSTFASPGRLLEGPSALTARGSERLTPAEKMRRFDEIAELHELIERLEDVPESSRVMSQWTQWSTAWYRLGILSDQTSVLDSAISAVTYFQNTVPVDSVTAAEWRSRRTQLENRRAILE